MCTDSSFSLFFFNDTATTEIYTLSLHDALPIYQRRQRRQGRHGGRSPDAVARGGSGEERLEVLQRAHAHRSEEHTSELQSLAYLVCRLLLEKKNKPRSRTRDSIGRGRTRMTTFP